MKRLEYKFSNQTLQLKSVARDLSKAKREIEDEKQKHQQTQQKLVKCEEEKMNVVHRNEELEEKLKGHLLDRYGIIIILE